jgi:hypothetical protein
MMYLSIQMASPKIHNGHTIYGSLTLAHFFRTKSQWYLERKSISQEYRNSLELTKQVVSSPYGTLILDRH